MILKEIIQIPFLKKSHFSVIFCSIFCEFKINQSIAMYNNRSVQFVPVQNRAVNQRMPSQPFGNYYAQNQFNGQRVSFFYLNLRKIRQKLPLHNALAFFFCHANILKIWCSGCVPVSDHRGTAINSRLDEKIFFCLIFVFFSFLFKIELWPIQWSATTIRKWTWKHDWKQRGKVFTSMNVV